MIAKLRSWWQKTSKTLDAVIIISLTILFFLLVLITLGYIFNWSWTGLHARTLYDWLQLLIIPAVLAVGGYLFNYTASRNERAATEKRTQAERDIAQDNQRESALQAYIDKISELLLKEHLDERTADGQLKPEYEQVRKIARVRTLTVLRILDAERKGSVLRFLYESGLIMGVNPIVDLQDANLSGVDMQGVDLSDANLRNTDLSKANFTGAILIGTLLRGANLREAKLNRINLRQVMIKMAQNIIVSATKNLTKVVMPGPTVPNLATITPDIALDAFNAIGTLSSRTELCNADLNGANLSVAYLYEANLDNSNLIGAKLTGANLTMATLNNAKLNNAIGTTDEQLKKAKSLKGAIMPDGSKHP